MGWHVPRQAFLPCKERVVSSILIWSTNYLYDGEYNYSCLNNIVDHSSKVNLRWGPTVASG